ncbi:Protein of unknown function, partial [Gryllus bimaculatus]
IPPASARARRLRPTGRPPLGRPRWPPPPHFHSLPAGRSRPPLRAASARHAPPQHGTGLSSHTPHNIKPRHVKPFTSLQVNTSSRQA